MDCFRNKDEKTKISFTDRNALAGFFNDGGFVLNFNNSDFDRFTVAIVGVPLQQHYGLSKGKSLLRFSDEATDEAFIKLIDALFEQYDRIPVFSEDASDEKKKQYDICRSLLERIKGQQPVVDLQVEDDKNKYILKKNSEARKAIENGELDRALTIARTLVEEMLITSIQIKDPGFHAKGDLGKIRKRFQELYNMEINPSSDQRITKLISGLISVIDSISEMRNAGGDAHGHGFKRWKVEPHHVYLALDSSVTLCNFIYHVVLKNSQ